MTERLAVEANGAVLEEQRFPGRQGRMIFAYLAAQNGRPVPRDELAELLWGDELPATWEKALRVLMTKLRTLLAECGIDGSTAVTSAFGCYKLTLPPGAWIDVEAAVEAVEQAEAALVAGDLDQARSQGSTAAALARRSFLPGEEGPWVEERRSDLRELLVRSLECLRDASFAGGELVEAVRCAEEVTELEPFRESSYRRLMEVHASAGNPAEALRVYERCRRFLADELGAYPSPETESVYRELLSAPSPEEQGALLEIGVVPQAVPLPAKVQRKTVTVLYCDVAGSTALGDTIDPEALQTLLARYFERMQAIAERHGGTVEKVIGEAVMAAFGVPVVHEDDALRAVRAADEMRDALPDLGLTGRIGVMTGEVVTGTENRLATGAAVNVAKRLEEAAGPGDVLIGQPTLVLVQSAVEAEPVGPLELNGTAEPVAAHRVVRVGDEPEPPPVAPFVGRKSEIAFLVETWNHVRLDRRCELVTVAGDAGIGKSRLANEFLVSIEATVVRGRCLPYGEGITYAPVVEVLKQLDLRLVDEATLPAIGSLLGETDTPTSADETAWAVRKVLEVTAQRRPLVALFDDIQWGEEAFLDLVEHVVLLSSDAPILMLCLARPELTERRPTWPVGLRLGALDDEDVDHLIPERLPDDVRTRIARAAGGNPLFVEEMVEVAREADGDIPVPPSLQALLATRLDQLEAAERSVLERAAVEGEVFHRGAAQALADDGVQLTACLASLVRKGLIAPDKPQIRGEDGFRFHHLLIRDAAYEALSKATRAQLHQRFASWLEHEGSDLVELDEVVGYHLERANAYRSEVDLPEDPELMVAARRHLEAGGLRAVSRQDYDAAASLLQRAAALVPESQLDLALETELGDVLFWNDRTDEALRRAETLVERASAIGDGLAELCARVHAARLRLMVEPDRAGDLAVLLEQALPVMEAAGDPMALYIGYYAQGDLEEASGRMDAALVAFERAFANADRAGYRAPIGILAYLRFGGSTPVAELLAWLDEIDERAASDQFIRAYRGWSLAKVGRFDEARTIIAEARAQQAERGGGLLLANLTAFESVGIELLADEPAAAVEFGEEGCSLHEELGTETFLPLAYAGLAQALYALGRLDDAETRIRRTMELTSSDDGWEAVLWRRVRAKLLARRGEGEEAEQLAREATVLAEATDRLDGQGDAYADLGEVLLLVHKTGEAAGVLVEALERYERKGNLVMAQRVRTQLEELRLSRTS